MPKPEIIGSVRSTYTRVVCMVCEEKAIEYVLTERPRFDPHPTFDAWRRSRRSPSGESNEIVRTNPLQNEEHG